MKLRSTIAVSLAAFAALVADVPHYGAFDPTAQAQIISWTEDGIEHRRDSASHFRAQPRTDAVAPDADLPDGEDYWQLHKRTHDSDIYRHVLKPDLYRALISSAPLNHKEGDVFTPIAPALKPDGAGGLEVAHAPYRARFPKDLTRPVRLEANGHGATFSLRSMSYDAGAEPIARPAASRVSDRGGRAAYPEVFPGVEVQYELHTWGLKSFFVLGQPPEPPAGVSETATLDFEELIETEGLEVHIDGYPAPAAFSTAGPIEFVDRATGKLVFRLPPPYATDARKGRVGMRYQAEIDGNTLRIWYQTPYAWLSSPDRAYPVRIDPSPETLAATYSKVLRASTTWEDGYVSSGRWNNNIYRSGIDFSTTVIPDGSAVTAVQLRLTVFDQAGTLRNNVARMTSTALAYFNANNRSGFWADVAGSEYLSNSNGFVGTGTRTASLLAAARTDVQCQLAANWFSVGFTHTTESGTNYRDARPYNNANPPAIIVTFTAASPNITVAVSAPVNLSAIPNMIPGTLIQHQVTATNSGSGSSDADSVVLAFPVPAGASLFVGNLGGAGTGPVAFANGSTPSGLSYSYTSLASTTDRIDFSNNNGAAWTYTPTPDASGFDASVTNFRVRPTGAFSGVPAVLCGGSGLSPSFSVQYRMRIK